MPGAYPEPAYPGPAPARTRTDAGGHDDRERSRHSVGRLRDLPGAPAGGQPDEVTGLLLGEVRTALLQHSEPVTPTVAREILQLRPGRRVLSATRPVAHVLSPELASGVHCQLATVSGTRVEGVGTALTRAAITGGRLIQASTRVLVIRRPFDVRPPWSHYLSQPGVVEFRGKADPDDLAQGFLGTDPRVVLDLGALTGRVLDRLQRSPELDRRPSFRAQRTRLRFAVRVGSDEAPAGPAGPAEFVVRDETLRTMFVTLTKGDLVEIVGLCEDLALHDWLLTTVTRVIEGSRVGVASGDELVVRLRPVIDHLLHLWMPAARVDEALREVWDGLERRPGFSRQWESLVSQIRDQISLAMITLLGAGPVKGAGGL
jgi:hypothetical protein